MAFRAKPGDNILNECTMYLGRAFNKLESGGDKDNKVIPIDFFTRLVNYNPMFGEMTEKGDSYK